MAFKCFIRIFNSSEKEIEEAFKKAIEKIYKTEGNIPIGTEIEISEWNDMPQIDILGSKDDDRCAFCKYFRQTIGEEKTKRNNCPF
jgi:hypothetical protein